MHNMILTQRHYWTRKQWTVHSNTIHQNPRTQVRYRALCDDDIHAQQARSHSEQPLTLSAMLVATNPAKNATHPFLVRNLCWKVCVCLIVAAARPAATERQNGHAATEGSGPRRGGGSKKASHFRACRISQWVPLVAARRKFCDHTPLRLHLCF